MTGDRNKANPVRFQNEGRGEGGREGVSVDNRLFRPLKMVFRRFFVLAVLVGLGLWYLYGQGDRELQNLADFSLWSIYMWPSMGIPCTWKNVLRVAPQPYIQPWQLAAL